MSVLTFSVIKSDEEIVTMDYFCGTVKPSSELSIAIRIWNNRYAIQSTTDATIRRLGIHFESIEDDYLLEHLTATVGGALCKKEIINSRLHIHTDTVLSGQPNNGDDSVYTSNFMDVLLSINLPERAKSDDMKKFYLTVFDN